jgi:hypothetical protein
MNLTFWMSWKFKWITQSEFDNVHCRDDYTTFEITDNSFCNYPSWVLRISDTRYLFKKSLDESTHFEWNYVWNTWLIDAKDLPKNTDKILYAVIIYEKQIYYTWAIIIAGLTFFVVMVWGIVWRVRRR